LIKNFVLIGFMATGKTVIGRNLAGLLKREFVDTDAAIEKLTGKTVSQIFAAEGEARFRLEEELLVQKLSSRDNLVIATGGGLVLNPENLRLLKKNGVLIALTASPEVIHERVKRNKNRPLLSKGDLLSRIKELMYQRKHAYAAAEITIDTGKYSIDDAVKQINLYLLERKYI
jgi:shikimate kinase